LQYQEAFASKHSLGISEISQSPRFSKSLAEMKANQFQSIQHLSKVLVSNMTQGMLELSSFTAKNENADPNEKIVKVIDERTGRPTLAERQTGPDFGAESVRTNQSNLWEAMGQMDSR
jgi:hypothetical protein